jgi:hypothetical protein
MLGLVIISMPNDKRLFSPPLMPLSRELPTTLSARQCKKKCRHLLFGSVVAVREQQPHTPPHL